VIKYSDYMPGSELFNCSGRFARKIAPYIEHLIVNQSHIPAARGFRSRTILNAHQKSMVLLTQSTKILETPNI